MKITAEMTREQIDSELKATSDSRKYRIRKGRSGKFFLERFNSFSASWCLEARESSTRWDVALDMVSRGWATMVSRES